MKYLAPLFLLVFVISCSKENYFLDQYQPAYKALPFFANYNLDTDIYGRKISSTEAIVYTRAYSIYTNDNFKTIKYFKYKNSIAFSGPIDGGDVKFFDGANAWVEQHGFWPYGQAGYILNQPNSGLNLDFSKLIISPAFMTPPNYSPMLLYLDSANFLFARGDQNYPFYMKLYKGNVFTNATTLVSVLNNEMFFAAPPIAVFQVGSLTFLLYQKTVSTSNGLESDLFFYITSDFNVWQGPFFFAKSDGINELIDLTGNENMIVAKTRSYANFTATGKFTYQFYLSIDRGKTWSTFTNLPSAPIFMQILSDNSIYAVLDASGNGLYEVRKLAKSFDGGKTWTIEDKLFYANRISFFDQLNGIATFEQMLQQTNDGGKTWELILSNP